MDVPLLAVRDLSVQYETNGGTIRALSGASLELRQGQALGLVGETGCGKSTLGLSVMGLLPPGGQVIAGRIEICGRSIQELPESQLAKMRGAQVAMILQDAAASLNPLFTAGDQVAMVVRKHCRLGRKAARRRVLELLETVELPDPPRTYGCYPHQLSGGMQQRVCIAMALACGAKLLIADEPTTGLDPTLQAQILDLLDRLRIQQQVALLLISHDLAVVAALCGRVAVLYAGRVVEQGRVEEVLLSPQHPYTQALLQAVPRPDSRDNPLHPVPGAVPAGPALPEGCAFQPRCPWPEDVCHREPPRLRAGTDHTAACHSSQSAGGWW